MSTRCPVCFVKLDEGDNDPDRAILDHSVKQRHPLLQWQKDWRRELRERQEQGKGEGRKTTRKSRAEA